MSEQLRQKTAPPEAVSLDEQPQRETVPLRVFLRARYRLRDANRAVRRLEAAAEFWGVRIESDEGFGKKGGQKRE